MEFTTCQIAGEIAFLREETALSTFFTFFFFTSFFLTERLRKS